MNDRVIDFSEQPAHLNVRNGLLVIVLRSVALEGGTAFEGTTKQDAPLKVGATEPETGLRSSAPKTRMNTQFPWKISPY